MLSGVSSTPAQRDGNGVELSINLRNSITKAGSIVEGYLDIKVTSSDLLLGELLIECNGFEELRSSDHTSTKSFLSLEPVWFQKPSLPASSAVIISESDFRTDYYRARVGRTRFRFQFQLPISIASSCSIGSSRRYLLRGIATTRTKDSASIITSTTESLFRVVEEFDDFDHPQFLGDGVSQVTNEINRTLEARTLDRTLFWRGDDEIEGNSTINFEVKMRNFGTRSVSGLKVTMCRRIKLINSEKSKAKVVTVDLATISISHEFKIGSSAPCSSQIEMPEGEIETTRKGILFDVEVFLKVELAGLSLAGLSLELPITICHPSSLPPRAKTRPRLQRGLTLPNPDRIPSSGHHQQATPLSPSMPAHYTHEMIQPDYNHFRLNSSSPSRQSSPYDRQPSPYDSQYSSYYETPALKLTEPTFLRQNQPIYSTTPLSSPRYDNNNSYQSFPPLNSPSHPPHSINRSPSPRINLPSRDFDYENQQPQQYHQDSLEMHRSHSINSIQSFRTPPPSSPSHYFQNSPSLGSNLFDEHLETIGEDGESQIGTGRSIFEIGIKNQLREENSEMELVSVPGLRSNRSSAGTSAEELEDMVEESETREREILRVDSPIRIRAQDIFTSSPRDEAVSIETVKEDLLVPIPPIESNLIVRGDGLSLLGASLAQIIDRTYSPSIIPTPASIKHIYGPRPPKSDPIEHLSARIDGVDLKRQDSSSTTTSTASVPSLDYSSSTLSDSISSTSSDPIECAILLSSARQIREQIVARPIMAVETRQREESKVSPISPKLNSITVESTTKSSRRATVDFSQLQQPIIKSPSPSLPISDLSSLPLSSSAHRIVSKPSSTVREQSKRYSMDQFIPPIEKEMEKVKIEIGRVNSVARGWSEIVKDKSSPQSSNRNPGRLSFIKSISTNSIPHVTTTASPSPTTHTPPIAPVIEEEKEFGYRELIRSPRVEKSASPTKGSSSRPSPWVIVESDSPVEEIKESRSSKSFQNLVKRFQ